MPDQVSRMDAHESRAWLALVTTAELLPAALDSQLQRDSELTHYEFIVLSALQQAPERRMRIGDLAATTNATLPRASKVISRLEGRGLATRLARVDDARGTDVHITSAGRRALVLAMPGHLDTARRLVLDNLTPAQLDALADALEPVVAALDPQRRFRARS